MPKQKRPTTLRTESELQEILDDTLDFIVSACARFDRGDTREYRQIAGSIRMLCRDTGMSHSLLGQVGLKDRRYLTCSPPLRLHNMLSECQLIELIIRPKVPQKVAGWRAVLDGAAMKFLDFNEWWTQPVLAHYEHETFTRAELIGYVADQDGAVHVDPGIDAAFHAMRREAFRYTDGRNTTDHPERHAIRQIAHELLKSLRPSYRRTHALITAPHAQVRAPLFAKGQLDEPKPLASYHLADLAAPCPCNSGKAYAICHRAGAIEPTRLGQFGGSSVAPPGAAFARVGFGVRPTD